MCVCVYAHECRCPKRPDEGVRPPGAGVPGRWVLDTELGSSEKKQTVLLTAELFLQLHFLKFNLKKQALQCQFHKGRHPVVQETQLHALTTHNF